MSLSVTRENFDEWMVPVYVPAPFIPCTRKAHACGINEERV